MTSYTYKYANISQSSADKNSVKNSLDQIEYVCLIKFDLQSQANNTPTFDFKLVDDVAGDAIGENRGPVGIPSENAQKSIVIRIEKNLDANVFNAVVFNEVFGQYKLDANGNKVPEGRGLIGNVLSENDVGYSLTAPIYNDGRFYPTTPMPGDIQALQAKPEFGANWDHISPDPDNKTGDDIYKFSDDSKDTQFYQTIWDAGGKDTIDFSDAQSPATINLNNGQFSTIHNSGGTYRVAIAFKPDKAPPEDKPNANALIENAVGGSGNDTIRGNEVANSLTGNAGNDDLFGEDGNDWLDGGNDLDRLYGGDGLDTIKAGAGNDEALGGNGNDLIEMGDGNDWARGGAGNDTVDGGAGENKLYGDGGDDTLVGQPAFDRLYGSYRHPDPRGDPRPDGDDVFNIVADDIPPYVTGQNNTILYTFGHRLDERGYYGNGDKIDLSEFGGDGWKLIHSRDPLQPGTIKVTNHTWSVDGYATSLLVGKDKDGDYFQLFIDDGSAYGWHYRVKDFIGVTSDFPDLA